MDLPTQTTRLEPEWVRLQLASIFASVIFEGICYQLNNIIRCDSDMDKQQPNDLNDLQR